MTGHTTENAGDVTEYRVLWRDDRGRWWSHTADTYTYDPKIAAAWLEQARNRDGRNGPTEAVIETRTVSAWRTIPPESVTP